jgi:hypothetical protein
MKNKLIRIGTSTFVNESTLDKRSAFHILFDGFQEFVYLSDYLPSQLENGTWIGALGHLMNDHNFGLEAACCIHVLGVFIRLLK